MRFVWEFVRQTGNSKWLDGVYECPLRIRASSCEFARDQELTDNSPRQNPQQLCYFQILQLGTRVTRFEHSASHLRQFVLAGGEPSCLGPSTSIPRALTSIHHVHPLGAQLNRIYRRTARLSCSLTSIPFSASLNPNVRSCIRIRRQYPQTHAPGDAELCGMPSTPRPLHFLARKPCM